ncbi:MAG: hypothetical protein QG656_1754, partial [Candidatus Hydrogenedentes bacterium]|nr:hypothetical protein [Candidatus Hydrogenedentota bacterium]
MNCTTRRTSSTTSGHTITARRAATLIVLCLVAIGLLSMTGCFKKRERPKPPPTPPTAAVSEPAPPAEPAAEPAPGTEPAAEPAPGTEAAPAAEPAPEGSPEAAPALVEPAAEPAEPAEEPAAPEPPKEPKAAVVTDFKVQVDSKTGSVKVVGENNAEAPLNDLLEQAYQADQKTTGKVVKSWVTDNEILGAEDVRDLLDSSWKKDSKEAIRVIRPWFADKMTLEINDIPALLTKAWGYDAGATRDTLRTWGDTYGFVDVSDPEALAEHNVVMADDINSIREVVKKKYGNDWQKVSGVKLAAAGTPEGAPDGSPEALDTAPAPVGAQEIPVQVSWASPRRIGDRKMRFALGDQRISGAKTQPVTLTPRNKPEQGVELNVGEGVDLPADWVQVQDNVFIPIAADYRKMDVPERGSPE